MTGSREKTNTNRIVRDKRLYLPFHGNRGLIYIVQGGGTRPKHPIRGKGHDAIIRWIHTTSSGDGQMEVKCEYIGVIKQAMSQTNTDSWPVS
jgi:hypothetical protein